MFTLNSPVILGVEARREPEEIFKESEFMLGTKPKEVLLVLPKENSEAQKFQNFNATFCNPWIFSAMAMAMSIYRTLCVLVFFLKISLQEMLIAFGNVLS